MSLLIVMFLPGGIAGVADRLRRGAPAGSSLEEAGEANADTVLAEPEESTHEHQ